MRVCVGSTNPVKVSAVKAVFSKVYDELEVIPVKVESGVSPTPFGENEIVRGALNRAEGVFNHILCDLSVGMEGGIVYKFNTYFLTCWCVLFDGSDDYQYGCGGYMPLPFSVINMVKKGFELGSVIDKITGLKDTKLKMGAIGILTRNFMTRQAAWEAALKYALASRLSPQFYSVHS